MGDIHGDLKKKEVQYKLKYTVKMCSTASRPFKSNKRLILPSKEMKIKKKEKKQSTLCYYISLSQMQQGLYVMSLMITRRDIDLNKYLGQNPILCPI